MRRLKMSCFRKSLVVGVASVLLLVIAVGEASSQTAGKPMPETPAEMAQAIAHAINAKAKVPETPNVLIAREPATSHDNVVELRYRANENRVFPHNSAEREERRLRFAHRFCFYNRDASLLGKPGVVIHQVLTAPDDSAPFEFIIDQSTCAALAADIKSRVDEIKAGAADMKRSLDEPKHVPTVTIRPDRKER
jgi:hypothetical protein